MDLSKQLQKEEFRFIKVRTKQKIPYEKEWQKTNNYKYNNKILQSHLKLGGNYGIVTGYGKLIVIDFDNEEYQEKIKPLLPKTLTIKTGGGLQHLYYYIDKTESFKILDEKKNTILDFQGTGKQVIGPGSTHPNGKKYEIINDEEIASIKLEEIKSLFYTTFKKEQLPKNWDVTTTEEKTNNSDDIIIKIKNKFSIKELLSEQGINTNKNPTSCPLHSSKGGKCLGFNDETWHCFHCEEKGDVITLYQLINKIDFKKSIQELTKKLNIKYKEKQKINENFIIIKINEKTGTEISRTVDIDKVANYLIKKYEFNTIFGKKIESCYAYDGKIHKENGRGIIKSETEKLLNSYSKKIVVDEIFEKIKRKTIIEKKEFEKTNINLIPLENGVFNIEKHELIDYKSEYNFKFIIPIKYDPEAKCLNWFKFIKEALYPEDISTMQEWFGFNLYREYFIKKAIVCKGPQDTGKSVFLDTLIKFLGEKNKTGMSLQKITSGSDFTKLSLKDKHANIFDDLSSKDLNDGGSFKVATGGGYISGEEKFGEYTQFRSFAKQTFATNKIPPVKDNDDLAYFGRWIIINFDNVPEKKDVFLRKKLWTEEEMSGILNWALKGLFRLLEKGKFSYSKTSEEIKQEMEISGVPLVAFSSEVLEKENGKIISKEEMFNIYSIWCEKEKKPRLSKEMLGRQLPKNCSYIVPERHKNRVWKNAKIKEEWIKTFQEQQQLNYDTSDTLFLLTRVRGKNKDNNGDNNDNNGDNAISYTRNIKKSVGSDNNFNHFLNFIKDNDDGKGVDETLISQNFDIDEMYSVLEKLKFEGLIYEPKPGLWSLVL